MIITCPNCQTRYQVAERAIGSAGRKVQCAQCQQSWNAVPEKEEPAPKPKLVAETEPATRRRTDKDEMFDEKDEAALDAVFAAAEEVAKSAGKQAKPEEEAEEEAEDEASASTEDEAAEAAEDDEAQPTADNATKHKRRREMLRRQSSLSKKMPLGRFRYNARIVVACLLVAIIGGGLTWRTDIVRLLPDTAGIYAAVGLPVNVVGLEFSDVETLRSMQNGVDVMLVTGQIHNISGKRVGVPAIVVSILDEYGQSVYSWSVTPMAGSVGPNEKLEFETRLNSAPSGAVSIKLAFADERNSQQ